MLYALICTDKPGSDANAPDDPARSSCLPQIAGRQGEGAQDRFTDGSGTPNGSLVIIDAFDREEAGQIAAADPYATAGLFEAVDIRPWSWVINNPES